MGEGWGMREGRKEWRRWRGEENEWEQRGGGIGEDNGREREKGRRREG